MVSLLLENAFPQFERELQIELTKRVILKEFKKGEIILKMGQPFKNAYFILKGCIKVYRENAEDAEFVVAYLEQGKRFAVSASDDSPPTITGGIALTPAQAAGLRLDPAPGFNGNVTFNYSAYDNTGNLSNTAAYTIPVGSPAALPVSLISFSGQRNGNDIIVLWKTENEINADHFEVYSTDGINFGNGGLVNANNGTINNY